MSAAVRAAAREVVGTDEFRPGQAEVIEAVLERDTLAVLASGTSCAHSRPAEEGDAAHTRFRQVVTMRDA